MDPVRIDAIGVGNRGEFCVDELQNHAPGATVVAGMDVSDESLRAGGKVIEIARPAIGRFRAPGKTARLPRSSSACGGLPPSQ